MEKQQHCKHFKLPDNIDKEEVILKVILHKLTFRLKTQCVNKMQTPWNN